MDTPDALFRTPLFRYALLLLAVYLFGLNLYVASRFLIPFCTAALLALLMLPLCQRLEDWKLPRLAAILICLLLILVVLVGIGLLLSVQIINFVRDLPSLQGQLASKLEGMQHLIEQLTDVTANEQIEFVKQRLSGALGATGLYLVNVLRTATGTITTFVIILIYTAFFLFYRDRFTRVVFMVTDREYHPFVRDILTQISQVTQRYLSGVLTVMLILATLNTIGLTVIGIRQALFFGVLAGLLNIIPYIGTFMGGLIPTLVALLTYESLTPALTVGALFISTQFLDNNFLTPYIVGGKVKVNALATIMALLIGGYLWGVAGMILFIPLTGIVKIIFDNVGPLRPFGYLIGDEAELNEH